MSSSKDIMTPEWCRTITSSQSQMMFIPTRTMAEWASFRDLHPTSISIASCIVAITGSCGGSANMCSTWSPSGYIAGSCGGSQTWSCLGSGGGGTASCNIANAPCEVLAPMYCLNNPYPRISCAIAPDITIAGKSWKACNVWANYVCEAGSLFQWWRNKAFPSTHDMIPTLVWPIALSGLAAADNANQFITNGISPNDWLTPLDSNRWGGEGMDYGKLYPTDNYSSATLANQALMQWPCPIGYHVPTAKDWCDALDSIGNTSGCAYQNSTLAHETLRIPLSGYRNHSSGYYGGENDHANYWTSVSWVTYKALTARIVVFTRNIMLPNGQVQYHTYWNPVRCQKN